MISTRVIPCLLLKGAGFVKTTKFADPIYLGDPINTVKIFNDKEVDEIAILDITATRDGQPPKFDLLTNIANQCFMPLSYGGGLRNLEDIRRILSIGFEKVIINSHALENPAFVRQAADVCGSQSVVVCLDIKKSFFGKYEVHTQGGKRKIKGSPADIAKQMEQQGAGEILLQSVDRDGTMAGYDIDLIHSVTQVLSIPVIACGGAGKVEDFAAAVKQGGASAVAAGSMFVFHGRRRAVLINHPTRAELEAVLP